MQDEKKMFEDFWTEQYPNADSYFQQFPTPNATRDLARLFSYEAWQGRQTEINALNERVLGLIALLQRVYTSCIMPSDDKGSLLQDILKALANGTAGVELQVVGGKHSDQETVRVMSAFLDDLAKELGTKPGDCEAMADAIQALKSGQSLPLALETKE